jgi:ribonucleoside-diphosphate reductase alpha chain
MDSTITPTLRNMPATDTMAGISVQIWDNKYRFKNPDGTPIDITIEDTWKRVASTLAAPEIDQTAEFSRFYSALENFKFVPAGRIVAGAGTGRAVTLFNCYVMGTIEDSLSSIFEHLREAALTMKQGGGIGYDFSTLRPKGNLVAGVGAPSSGPLSFMNCWDVMCATIMSAGARRGAMMATMCDSHPDIYDFITAKQERGKLTNFNLSVLVSNALMKAVKDNTDWDLHFDGKIHRTVKARDLWDTIMRSNFLTAEPGVIFLDRVQAKNNLYYAEQIRATNPCITADTWIHTGDGPRQVSDLLAKQFTAIVDGKPHLSTATGFFFTGTKETFLLKTKEGHELKLTGNHQLMAATSVSRFDVKKQWKATNELSKGNKLVLQNHRCREIKWTGNGTTYEGYLMGLLVGDGTVKTDKTIISAWTKEIAVNGNAATDGTHAVMAYANEAAHSLNHRCDFNGWHPIAGRNEHRLSSASLAHTAERFGIYDDKQIGPAIEKASSAFQAAFLKGYFDADGSIQGNQSKSISIRLSQSNMPRLQAVQRMLARFGICSVIYENRREAGQKHLPDGKEGQANYDIKAQHELVIATDNIQEYAHHIGFQHSEKATALSFALKNYVRSTNRERFVVTVDSITSLGMEDVYDCRIPGINAFDGNGFYAHNCGEQPLPPYGACLLGSINLSRLVQNPFTKDAYIDETIFSSLVATAIHMLDNTIDCSNFPLEAQREEAQAKRRIGLGITGLADALVMLNITYGSDEGVAMTEKWGSWLRRYAYLASVEIAKEKGPFPLYRADEYLAGETVMELDPDVREAIRKYGIRNSHLTSIAPTGTISLVADNASSGIEPIFAKSYERKVLQIDGSRQTEIVEDYAVRLFHQLFGNDTPLTEHFVTAQTLTPLAHLRMQAAMQKYIDSAISKTINLPAEISFEDFRDVYTYAYEAGCKGCTTYRPNDITGSVLTALDSNPKPPEPAPDANEANLTPTVTAEHIAASAAPQTPFGHVMSVDGKMPRPRKLNGATYQLKLPGSPHSAFLTINYIEYDGQRRPFEMFISSKDNTNHSWTAALTRTISAIFRRGGDVSFIADELKDIFDPMGGHWENGKYVPSQIAAIGNTLEEEMISMGYLTAPQKHASAHDSIPAQEPEANNQILKDLCPKCSQPGVIIQAGCRECTQCGWSKCG